MKTRSQRSLTPSASEEFLRFTSSVSFDSALWRHDIAGTLAHARALCDAGILSKTELGNVEKSLKGIALRISNDQVVFDPSLEDIHMNIEKLLIDDIGDTGAKIHTGRSRNDQVALDMRLWARERIACVTGHLIKLQAGLVAKAKVQDGVILPGYTHMQHAQPVLLSHHMMAHVWRFDRDVERLVGCYERTNISPLGSGALAGTSFLIDRKLTAKTLGMDGITENSLDAVSDRDFAAEAAFVLSLVMIHLSSLCEELVLWSSQEFGFLRLPKEMSSGSSMMPQKRNPDLPELVRAKSGRAVGDLVAILTLMKSLPLAYNRDLQEDKENLFDVFDTVEDSLVALTTFLEDADFDKVRMRKSAEAGLMTATDLADFLTTSGVPFRKAHSMVKDIAERAGGDDDRFLELSSDAVKNRVGEASVDIGNLLSIDQAVARRCIDGGTAGSAVKRQIALAERSMSANESRVNEMKKQIATVDGLLGF